MFNSKIYLGISYTSIECVSVNALNKNMKHVQALLDETSALVDNNTILDIYNKAIERKYNFLYIDLMADNINEMFYLNVDTPFIIN